VSSIQTGFAQITPIQGTGAGLVVSEVLRQQFEGITFQASVPPSPLVTLTNVVVDVNPDIGRNTGIAIVNPTDGIATVSLNLRNPHCMDIGSTTVVLNRRQQLSQFVTQLFPAVPELSGSFTGVLFISTDIPVSVLGLAFTGPSFSSLPVSTQLAPNSVVAVSNSTFTGALTTASATTPEPQPLPPTVIPLPSNVIGVAPTQPIATTPPLVAATEPVNGSFSTATTTSAITTSTTPPPATGASLAVVDTTGSAANTVIAQTLLIPQVAMGGGWTSEITIVNTSPSQQIVRVDFFDSLGGVLAVPGGGSPITVPPAGLAVLSAGQ